MRTFLSISTVSVAAVVLGITANVWACNSAGPNKHVGNVTAIDLGKKTFSIRDAETDHLITFQTSDSSLRVLKVNDRVLVGFKEDHGKMIALDIQS